MSTFVGPFGRILPTVDGLSPTHDPRPSPNPSFAESRLFHLPPPHTPGGQLQFGPEPYAPKLFPSAESKIDYDHRGRQNEQLPSVSQLLTPVSRSSATSPYRRPRSDSQPPLGNYPLHRQGPVTHARAHANSLPVPVQESQLQPQQPRSLPPISQLPVPNPDGGARSLSSGPHLRSPVSPGQNVPSINLPPALPHPPGAGSPADSQPSSTVAPVRPHVIEEKYIDGEGLCYIYVDGSYCPKSIDGVPVNASWGVTKAGRPRKRLAQACLTCREKKIRCHPNLPKCEQCQKSGRVCRYQNAPRGSRKCQIESSRETPQVIPSQRSYVSSESPYALERSTSLPGRYGHTPDSGMSMHAPSVNDYAQTIQDVAYSISSPHDSSISSITTNTTTTKKRRLSRSSLTGGDESFKRSLHNGDGSTTSPAATTSSMVELQLPIADYSEFLMEELEEPIKRDDPQAREWHADPYEVDPERTIHYIESYFTHMNDSQYALLPREPFLRWLTAPDHGQGQPPKSLEDKMLLYWMMTMGCMFSVRPDRLLAMKRFSRVARYAVEHTAGGLTLQLAQCRIIMSFWYLAMGAVDKSWDAIGAAVRTAFGLGYNVESNITVHESREDCEYGLLPPALMECRRRTFWIAFLFDTVFVRLPCREEVYEAQQSATVPYFQASLNKSPLTTEDTAGLSPMSFLIKIMSLWGDVSDEMLRLSLLPTDTYGNMFEKLYASVIQQTDEWAMRLPGELTLSSINMQQSTHAKKTNTFILNHLFYHATLLTLNRYIRSQAVREFTVDQCIRRARHHAVEMLRICLALTQSQQQQQHYATNISPALACLVLSAVDVVSAAGLITDLDETLTLCRGGLTVIRDLAGLWSAVTPLAALAETRVDALAEANFQHTQQQQQPQDYRNQQDKSKSPFRQSPVRLGFAVDSPSLDSLRRADPQPLGGPIRSHDLFYGEIPRMRVLMALGVVHGNGHDDILWIR